jgi:hypothetical protein
MSNGFYIDSIMAWRADDDAPPKNDGAIECHQFLDRVAEFD